MRSFKRALMYKLTLFSLTSKFIVELNRNSYKLVPNKYKCSPSTCM